MVQHGRRVAALCVAMFTIGGAPARAAETLYVETGGFLAAIPADRPASPFLTLTPITGLDPNDNPVSIDVRPATQTLYLLAYNTNASPDTIHLYTLNPATAVATSVGSAVTSPLVGAQGQVSYTMDFNPVADRIRVVAGDNTNFRMNPTNGALITPNDTTLAFAGGDPTPAPPVLHGLAYDNSVAGAVSTTAFGVDVPPGSVPVPLVRIGGPGGSPSPNGGTVTTIGPSGLTTGSGSFGGLDVSGATGTTYTAVSVFNSFSFTFTGTLYTVNLGTGAFSAIPGSFGGLISDLAVAPTARLELSASTLSQAETAGSVTVTVTRTGATAGTATVDYATSDGSATAGSDYTATSGTLSFADGETSKTFAVPIADDTSNEGREAFTVELSNATGNGLAGAVVGRRLATVTIEDNDAPPPVTPTPPPTPDTTKPTVTLKGVPGSLARAKFLKGFIMTLFPSEAATFDVTLEGKTSKATLASIRTTLFSKHLKLAATSQTVKVKPNRKGVGKVRKTRKVTLRVVTTDAAGNRTTTSKTIRVKPDPKKKKTS